MIKKKGLSTVVTTLIIILLVLVAIGIVWVVIANLVEEGSEQIFLDKFTTDLDIKNVNIDNSSGNGYAEIDIKRNVGKGDLEGIKFIFNDGQNSEIFELTGISLDELGERRFNFTLLQLDIDNVQTISISPLYKSDSGKTITGGIIASYRLKGAGILGSCVANCSGKVCGSDGCGGICGTCPSGEYCSGDQTQCIVGVNPCDLTSASWSTTNVVEGNTVTMNAVGTQCSGTTLNFSIYENGFVGDDFVTSISVSSLSTTWVAQWLDDGGTDPEYYFTVTVVDNPSEQVTTTADLTVTQAAQTCAQQGGNICTGGETCSGNILSATDSNSCCDVTCNSPSFPSSYIIRDLPSTVAPNEQIVVNLDIYSNETIIEERLFVLEERIPSQWTVISNDFSGSTPDSHILRAYVAQGFCCINPEYHFTYTIQAPSSSGTYTFDGIFVFESFVEVVSSTNCGNGVCEQTADKSQDELDSANSYFCTQDCQGDSIFGPTIITVA